MGTPLRVLIVSTSESEASRLIGLLRAGGYDPEHQRVETLDAMIAVLDGQHCDIILASRASGFDIREAPALLSNKHISAPVIAVADTVDQALDLLLAGAHDYILRSELACVLLAIVRVMREAGARREHEQAVRELSATKQRLKSLSVGILEMQESERRHLALELHDEIGQALTSVKMQLQSIKRMPLAKQIVQHLEESFPVVDRALQQVRTLCLNLRPPHLDDLGLVSALRALVVQQARLAGWVAHFSTDLPSARWESYLETTCFRIAQEALTNVARYGEASEIWVELNQHGEELHLSIRDDGVGFDVQAARERAVAGCSLGLIGLEDRVELAGGRLLWDTRPGRGLKLHAALPLIRRPEYQRRWRDRLGKQV
jgi:signal transduction histidine kinase